MKPAYEIVRADELQPDDLIALDIHSHNIHVDRLVKGGGLVTIYPSKDVLSYKQPVLRHIPPERNPEVLERALELMITGWGDRKPHDTERQIIEQFKQQAIRELESEAGNGK